MAQTTEQCCKEHPNVSPSGRVRIITERWGGVDRISIRLEASHPCGIDGYSVSVSVDAGGGMRERILREDVMGIDCNDNKKIEVIWDIGQTGSGRATSNVKGTPISESSYMSAGHASDLDGKQLTAVFAVTSCCETKAGAEIKIAKVTFRPPITDEKNLT
jgi:hypothetical protein